MPKPTIDIFAEPEDIAYLWIAAESKTVEFTSAGDDDDSHFIITVATLITEGVVPSSAINSIRVATIRDGNPASPSSGDPLLGTIEFVFLNNQIYTPEEFMSSGPILIDDTIIGIITETNFNISGTRPNNCLVGHMVVLRGTTTGTISVRYCTEQIENNIALDSEPDFVLAEGDRVTFFAVAPQVFAIKVKTDHLLDTVVEGFVNDLATTPLIFKGSSGLSSVDNFYCSTSKSVLVFTGGPLKGIARKIVNYIGATRQITLAAALPSAPPNISAFMIVGVIE